MTYAALLLGIPDFSNLFDGIARVAKSSVCIGNAQCLRWLR